MGHTHPRNFARRIFYLKNNVYDVNVCVTWENGADGFEPARRTDDLSAIRLTELKRILTTPNSEYLYLPGIVSDDSLGWFSRIDEWYSRVHLNISDLIWFNLIYYDLRRYSMFVEQ